MADPGVDWDQFATRAADLGAPLTAAQIASLQRYQELLVEWNQRFNLTAIERPDEILTKHFLDSLSPALLIDFSKRSTLIDVGTGAGFPGLVLKIAYPHLRVTLLDAVQKRLHFLDRVTEELGLTDVRTVHARAEDAAGTHTPATDTPLLRERFDIVVARAVARLNVLAEWLVPFARVGGGVLAMKGPDVAGEVEEARRALELLGAGAPIVRELQLPGTDVGRSLVLLPKARPTPRAYPRRPGTARKAPL